MELESSVEFLKGIGPKTAVILKKAGIKTVRDFFYNLPKSYDNFMSPSKIKDIEPGKVVIKGHVTAMVNRRARFRRLNITEAVIRDDTSAVRAVWFNQAYRAKQFADNKEYLFTGVFELKNGRYQLTSPSAVLASEVETGGGFEPVYVAHGKLKTHDFKRLMNNSRAVFNDIPDLLPTVKSGTAFRATSRRTSSPKRWTMRTCAPTSTITAARCSAVLRRPGRTEVRERGPAG